MEVPRQLQQDKGPSAGQETTIHDDRESEMAEHNASLGTKFMFTLIGYGFLAVSGRKEPGAGP